MKKINIAYWVCTIIFAGLMLFSAVPNVIINADSVKFLHDFLGYPVYFIAFIGVMKVLGVLGILLPVNKTLKEWAYAGLFFDLIGASYSVFKVQPDISNLGMLMFILPGVLSYYFYRKRFATPSAAPNVRRAAAMAE